MLAWPQKGEANNGWWQIMTKREFFEVLKQTDRRWIVLPDGGIRARRLRRGGKRDCPITAVARLLCGSPFAVDDYTLAAKALGLGSRIAWDIMAAADALNFQDRKEANRLSLLRRKLFQILNLPKEKKQEGG